MIKLSSLRAAKFKQLDDLSLAFPSKGSVLIQGLNEAGKSTLFESIYFALFGRGLVTEDGSRNSEDLIHYQAARAFVQLGFTLDEARLNVRRTLNRGKPNAAVLEVAYAGGRTETITNLTAVNKRIVAELGLDGEALLNSCFVEQKKLEKIESLGAQQRRETLLRLLNLERLSLLEARYKPAAAGDLQLQQLRDRLTLAAVQRDLPSASQRLQEVEQELRLMEALQLRALIRELEESAGAERQALLVLGRRGEDLLTGLEQIERLKAARDGARSAGELLLALAGDEQDLAELAYELVRLHAHADRLPAIEDELGRLDPLIAQLIGVEQRDQALLARRHEFQRAAESAERVGRLRQSIEDRQQALDGLTSELEEVNAALQEAETAERRSDQAQLLTSWLQIREVAQLAGEAERQLSGLRQEQFDLQQELAERQTILAARRRATAINAGAALALFLAGAALLATGRLFALAAIPLLAALGWSFWRSRRALAASLVEVQLSEGALVGVQTKLNREEGAHDLAARTRQDPARLAEIEESLRQASLGAPVSVEQARFMLAELAEQPDTAVSTSVVRQRLGALHGKHEALCKELDQLQAEVREAGDVEGRRAALALEIEQEQQAIAQARETLPAGFADAAEGRERAAALRAERQSSQEAAARARSLEAAQRERQERLDARRAEAELLQQSLMQAVRDCGLAGDSSSADGCRAIWRTCSEQINELDESRLRREAADVNAQVAAGRQRITTFETEAAGVQSRLAALNIEADQLAGRSPLGGSVVAELQREQRELIERTATLRHRQAELQLQLSLQGVTLDYEEAAAALAELEQRLQVGRQAYRIVALARKNIVTKVLPNTVRNMRLLLPLLTNERYRDVEITDDYKIRVWDDTARALKAKDIFSGGTRDQFSLALRLAFALATLPEELGTAPGFIFLDEPLSSFDDARAEALVQLLTRGVIAESFDQIFVISHNRTFDEALFDYHLQLEGGCIVASDLPSAAAGEPQGQLQLAPSARPEAILASPS